MKGYVYILKSLRNGQYYVGSTNDVNRRLEEHNSGRGGNTTERLRPLELIFSQEYSNLLLARKVEMWLKKLKDRNFIERIIKEGMISKR